VDVLAAERSQARPAGRERALALLALAMLLSMTTWFSASAVIPQLKAAWGLSPSAAAWLTIAVQVGFVVGALASSALSLADVFATRKVFALSAVAAAATNMLLVTARGPSTGIPLRFRIGSGAAGCYLGGVLGDRWGRVRTTILAMGVSGACAASIGLLFGRSPAAVLALGVLWGISVVADSAQFSTIVTEVADPAYVGTALTAQLAVGFTLTVVTIWLIPFVRDASGWWPAFALLAAGPALGILAMLRLRTAPEAARIAGGRG